MNQTNIVNSQLTGCVPRAIDFRDKYRDGNRWHVGSRWHVESQSILKGLRNKAQGCEARATLGVRLGLRLYPERVAVEVLKSQSHNPFRVAPRLDALSQGSSSLATLGSVSESRWDSPSSSSALSSFSSSSSLAVPKQREGRSSTAIPLHRRAFTLIELLVVIAVMAILAALVIPVTGAVKAASTKARVRTELAQLETAIDRYKIKLGHYPPDNPPATPASPLPLVNQLYYELMGTTNDSRFYQTLDGSVSVDVNSFGALFGPKVAGFVNSTRGGGGDEGASAQKFLGDLKPGQIAKAPSGATILVGIPWQKGPPPFDTPPFPGAPTLNPWRYNSSNPTHNPNSYDLWLDVVIGSKVFRICNWSKQPLRITDRNP